MVYYMYVWSLSLEFPFYKMWGFPTGVKQLNPPIPLEIPD